MNDFLSRSYWGRIINCDSELELRKAAEPCVVSESNAGMPPHNTVQLRQKRRRPAIGLLAPDPAEVVTFDGRSDPIL